MTLAEIEEGKAARNSSAMQSASHATTRSSSASGSAHLVAEILAHRRAQGLPSPAPPADGAPQDESSPARPPALSSGSSAGAVTSSAALPAASPATASVPTPPEAPPAGDAALPPLREDTRYKKYFDMMRKGRPRAKVANL